MLKWSKPCKNPSIYACIDEYPLKLSRYQKVINNRQTQIFCPIKDYPPPFEPVTL